MMQVTGRQKAEAFAPMKEVTIDLSDTIKRNYTDEENYRAYKLFSIMDLQFSGTITMRELYRVLKGDTYRTIKVIFDHADCGIDWKLDEEGCCAVLCVHEDSPLGKDSLIVPGMRLAAIDGSPIPQKDARSLDVLHEKLIKAYDQSIELEFIEPLLYISEFGYYMDIKANGVQYSVKLPIGAVYDLKTFERHVMKAFAETDDVLSNVLFAIEPKTRQIHIGCEHFKIKLLFKTGPNAKMGCSYALGFPKEDTKSSTLHMGQPLLIDLNLGITDDELDILMTDLFAKFDRDGSGEFEFEEFRAFYIKFLDSEEARLNLREYAQYEFRDREKEAYWRQKLAEIKERMERRRAAKARWVSTLKEQQKRFQAQSADSVDHVRRRYKQIVRDQYNLGRISDPQEVTKDVVVDQFGNVTEYTERYDKDNHDRTIVDVAAMYVLFLASHTCIRNNILSFSIHL
jgi:Ca2+-binding EF-hand superfamily protein